MRPRELIRIIERTADPRRAASWDCSGVQIAGTRPDCARLAVTLDPLPGVVAQALDWGADFLLTHHPLLLKPRLPDRIDDYHQVLRLVLGQGAWLYAAHTSLDVCTDGPAGWLAEALGLTDRRILEPAGATPRFQSRLETPSAQDRNRCLQALAPFAPAGAASPIGATGLDVIHPEADWPRMQAAVLAACPDMHELFRVRLEAPAAPYGYGLVGELPEPMAFAALTARLGALLSRSFFTLAGEAPQTVRTLAYCPGSGADMAPRAFAAGADVYVTGDLKYHQATAVPQGKLIMDVGHFALEDVMLRTFARDLADTLGADGPHIRYFSGNDPFSVHFPEGTPLPRTE